MTTWFRLPLIVRAAAIGVGWLAYLGLMLRLPTPENAAALALPVGIACAFGSAVVAAADYRLHSKFDTVDRMSVYRRALRTGKLPEGAEVDVWARWLRGSEAAVGVGALCGFPFVMFGLLVSLDSRSPYRWVPVALFTLLLGWGATVLVRRAAAIKQLTAAVQRRRASVRPAATTPTSKTVMTENTFEMPLAGRLASSFLMWSVVAFLVLLLVDLGTLAFGGPWIMRLDVAAGLAALVGLAWALLGEDRDLRRNFASYDKYLEYHRTLRTGEMPADIEPELWHRRLAGSRQENWARAMLAGFFTVLGIAAIAAGRNGYHWVIASLCELMAIWLLINWWVARERLRRLAKAVDRQAVRQTWG
ncbi:hypothetical protein ACIA48_17250 [Mycobacterium sp. NPDC051804]|uniref:hypothetical protein n=1 Tax=Mycobacterium sp. NPDC051804 TaxID=3364295 RepID=UPI0037A489F2